MSRRTIISGRNDVSGFGLFGFSESALELIHTATLEVLWHTGIKTTCKEAQAYYEGVGCSVDAKHNMVYIPAHIVEDAIISTPSSVLLAGRDPKNDLHLEGNRVNFCNFSKGVNVVDIDTGVYRPSTYDDQVRAAVLVDALEEYDLLDVAVECRDLPPEIGNLASYKAMATNSSKHCTQSAHSRREAEKFMEMAFAVAGGKEAFGRRPVASTVVCPTSPLTISPETTEPIIVYAQNNAPCTVLSMAMAGGTGPVTLAGTLVTHNAEVLAGIVLGQAVQKGAPNLYGSSTTIMDLRSAAATIGCPELGMLSAAVAKLAQFYKIPSYVAGS